ncbi:MAG: outer membrane protein transport protein, partial [Sulfurimonadaceae bacterium]|nr:outer membrane protein transport protein [Sulfurimonadaceae bacterium]
MKKLLVLSLAASTALMASGYRIPEVSTDAVALSAACVANASGADAAYYNPAKMVYNDNADLVDASLTYIHLTSINFKGSGALTGVNIDSEKENFLVPSLHYTSPALANGMRWGLSIVSPAGLTKRWKSAPANATSEEFTLETVEVNPTIAMPINDRFSVAAGVRM